MDTRHTAPSVGELTIQQRKWLYGHMFWMSYNQSEIEVKKRLLFRPVHLWRKGYNHEDDWKYNNELEDIFSPLYILNGLSTDEDIPSEIINELNIAVEYAKKAYNTEIHEKNEINNLHQLLYLEILSMIQSETKVRKCKCCSKYFVVTDRKIVYCDREINGKICFEVGSNQSYQSKLKSEPELKIYNRAYKTRHARVTRGTMENSDFLEWCNEAKNKLNKVRTGELEVSDFEEWLKT